MLRILSACKGVAAADKARDSKGMNLIAISASRWILLGVDEFVDNRYIPTFIYILDTLSLAKAVMT